MNQQTLTRNLATLSVGLGLAELLAPRHVARLIGVSDEHDTLIRVLGARELASGLGILQGKSSHFLWSRVAGDAIDLGLLGMALNNPRNDHRRVRGALAAVAVVTALDVIAGVLQSRAPEEPGWRIREPQDYEAGFTREDPAAMRAHADETMSQYQSGHVQDSEDLERNAPTPAVLAGERSGLQTSGQ